MDDKIAIFTDDGTTWILEVNNRIVIDKTFHNPYEAFIFYQKNSFNLTFMEKEVMKNV